MQLLASKSDAEAQAVSREIDVLTTEYDEIRSAINAASPRYASFTQPRPLTLAETQQMLPDDTMLLEYALVDERSYLWSVTRTDVSTFELPGRAEIEGAARNVYESLVANQPVAGESFEQRQARVTHANGQFPTLVENLSQMVLGPVASRLGKKRLLIVADGALQYIPFQILTLPEMKDRGTGGSAMSAIPLVADHEIVNEPSASALALLLTETTTRKPASNSVAVLADPVFESDDPRVSSNGALTNTATMTAQLKESETRRALRDIGLTSQTGERIPRLLASGDEADAIMSAAPWWSGFKAVGFEASRSTAMSSKLEQYRIVHFATHGLLNNEHPELSGIVLSLVDHKGQPQDGFLRLHDIYNLKLPVDLVVLSACNTGLGKDVRGEGLIGLTRGFMYAGASSVVASLWKVDDEATAELMRLFYGYMLRDGLAPAAALRKAQLEMSQQKRWQSPYFWAGFIIQGQYIQKERTTYLRPATLALLGGLAAAIVFAAFFARKRRRTRVL
jgi:CHAT domain-containing protein